MDDGTSKQEVNMTLTDGSRWLNCSVHLPAGFRISDVMNDERKFLPLDRDGKFVMVHKDQIAFMVEV